MTAERGFSGLSVMEVLQITEWGGDLERAERVQPEPGDGKVLIDVEATITGLTDANVIGAAIP